MINHRSNTLPLTLAILALTVLQPAYAEDGGRLQPQIADRLNFGNPFSSPLPKKSEIKPKVIVVPAQKETPTPPAPVTPPNLLVKGLVWNTDRPQAIINDQVVGVGDRVGETTIRSITRNGIGFEFMKTHFTLNPDTGTAKPSQQFN